MKLTIIVEDGAVYKDKVSFANLDLSSAPANIHALQFDDVSNSGWIEFKNSTTQVKPQNEVITELPSWAITAMTKWDEAKVAYEAAVLAAQLDTSKQNSPNLI